MTEDSEANREVTMPEQIVAELDVLKFVNLALMQNGLPVAQDLRVENQTNEVLRDVVCSFSSIHGSQIDAGEGGRTKAVGAGHLKAFLEYAERGIAVSAGPDDSGRASHF